MSFHITSRCTTLYIIRKTKEHHHKYYYFILYQDLQP